MSLAAGNASSQPVNGDSSERKPAGKQVPVGEGTKACLQEGERPTTPPVVKKFFNSLQPQPGAVRVHHGKANDPDVASTLVHGLTTKLSLTAKDLLYPPKKTSVQQRLQENLESVYASTQKAPLGRSHDQLPNLPPFCDDKTTYGRATSRGSGVASLINPPKTVEELEMEEQDGHGNYVRTHSAYFVGEQIDRKYNWSDSAKKGTFGVATPHYNDGKNACQSLRWRGQSAKKKKMDLPPDHTFGIMTPPDEYGAGGVVHSAVPGHYMRDREPHRSRVNAVRDTLKRLNFSRFGTMLEAFRYYDQDGKGLVSTDDVQRVCDEFGLDVSRTTLEGLMEFCDVDSDGIVDFVEFSNYLTWREKLPIKPREQQILLTGIDPGGKRGKPPSEPAEATPVGKPLVKPEDLEIIKIGSPLKTVRTLRRPTNPPGHFFTSSSVIGTHGTADAASGGRTYGIPSMRTDLPLPSPRRVSDKTNYGDSSTAWALLHPSVYALNGVHEEHFNRPRSKAEIAEIFRNVGVNVSEETFEDAWKLASMRHPAGELQVRLIVSAGRSFLRRPTERHCCPRLSGRPPCGAPLWRDATHTHTHTHTHTAGNCR
ncbi:EF-hand domain-containing family member B isoform X2 [Nelusetta ayraudi]|uniref:EF-hand domain-containing family member B isoform X2 n=1 Tax=Nelusetta ayraudi TaxID=303726 RepID=UPI003F71912A